MDTGTDLCADDEKRALLLIDLQQAFFDDPALAEQRGRIIEAVNRLVDAARRAGAPVFVVTTVHSRDRSTWTLNMLDDGQGYLFSGDPGTEVLEDVDLEGVTRLEKTRDSALLGTDLSSRLRNLEVDRILLAGVSTHGCIAQTARDAYAHNLRTAVVTDAVADERDDYMRVILEQLVEDRQADLLAVEDAVQWWRRAGAGSGPDATRPDGMSS